MNNSRKIQFDKQHICDAFKTYADEYNSEDTKIRLKIDHTYRVAGLCDTIAQSLGMDEFDRQLAWTCGMLHDIGRFEQVRRYGTFLDAVSVDHAKLGADLLFQEGLFERFADTYDACAEERNITETDSMLRKEYAVCRALMEKVIRVHNMFRVPQELTERERIFADILRDADKIDILRVNCDTPMEEIYNVSLEELKQAAVSDAVKQAFDEGRCAKRDGTFTPADYMVGHICLIFELVYPASRKIAYTQGYVYQLLDFKSDHPDTAAWMVHMKQVIQDRAHDEMSR